MSRDTRRAVLAVVGLGAFVAFMLFTGSRGAPRPEVDPVSVEEALGGAERWGSEELHVSGWYAALDADCDGDTGGVDPQVAWLQRDCPLRVLLPDQPADDVAQATLEAEGLRLSAPNGRPFPSRATPDGPNTRGQELVFIGHFADPAADGCVPERVVRCRSTFVVSDYDGLVR